MTHPEVSLFAVVGVPHPSHGDEFPMTSTGKVLKRELR